MESSYSVVRQSVRSPSFFQAHLLCRWNCLCVSLLSLPLFGCLNFHLFCCPALTFNICLASNLRLSFLLQTEQFVHTLKDELVKSALLALHTARPGYVSKSQKQAPAQGDQQQDHNPRGCEQNQSPSQGLPGHSPTMSVTESAAVCNNVEASQTTPRGEKGHLKHQESIPHRNEYDEEEWVSADTSFGHKGTQNCNFTLLTPMWMEVLVTSLVRVSIRFLSNPHSCSGVSQRKRIPTNGCPQ